MEIVVLIKPVPEAEARLRPDPSGTDLDTEGVKFVLAGYDESAVEQALLLKEAVPGSTVRALALGPAPRTDEVLRAALALGVDHATAIEGSPEEAHDPIGVARALAFAIRRYPHALVLAGKQSLDDGSGIVPSAVAELLGHADFGSVADLRWDPATSRFTFHQIREGTVRAIEVPPPIVVGLQQAWNDPRTAKLPMILKSRRAPIDRIPRSEVDVALDGATRAAVRSSAFRLPAPRTGAKMIEYKTPEEAAEKLVRLLAEEAKVLP